MGSDPDGKGAVKRPTISDVAAHAGTSKGTVSFVLNGRAGVAPATRARVLAAIDALGFQPNHLARSLASSHANAIGLIVARAPQTLRSDSFFASFIAGVESGITDADSAVLLRFAPNANVEREIYRALSNSRRVDGVIVTDLRRVDDRLALLEDLGLPAVTLNRPGPDSPFTAVSNDDATGINAAAGHLHALGHRRIARVSGPDHYLHSMQRGDLWNRALAVWDLTVRRTVAGDFTADGGVRATQRLLDLPLADRPTAIVFDNDTMAMAGAMAAQRLGFSIPGDLSIVGFDDTELAAYISPALTTIHTDPFRWGEAAAATLLSAIRAASPVDDVLVGPSQLVLRGSTGPA